MQFISILAVLGLVSANIKKIPSGRIVGGYEVLPIFQYPWIVSLQYKGKHNCGGTIYNSKTIISAAHCVFGTAPKWKASVHRHDISKSADEESGVTYEIKDKKVHPKYDEHGDARNDISIWKINAADIKFDAINLDNINLGDKEGTLLKVIGWGTTSLDGDLSTVLLQVKVPVFDLYNCKKAYPELHTLSQFCAGYPEGGKDSCQGDSGGPIFISENGNSTLVGIVSWGRDCASKGYPGVYTRISSTLDFIIEHANYTFI